MSIKNVFLKQYKAIRNVKRESWIRIYQRISDLPVSIRVHKMLTKDPRKKVRSIKSPDWLWQGKLEIILQKSEQSISKVLATWLFLKDNLLLTLLARLFIAGVSKLWPASVMCLWNLLAKPGAFYINTIFYFLSTNY